MGNERLKIGADALYIKFPELLFGNERPSPVQQFTDYMQFLACNAVVDMFDFQRSVRAFMDSDLGLGVIFGATATVFCFILSGAGW